MAKKKMSMYQTFKISIFGNVSVDGAEVPAVSVIDNHVVVNSECCDLRTIKERYNPKTKELAPSVVDCISNAESVLAMHYGKRMSGGQVNDCGQVNSGGQIGGNGVSGESGTDVVSTAAVERNTLYDFITVDCSDGNDADTETKRIKELLCFDGLYMPLSKLEAIGYAPHNEIEIAEIVGEKYVRYRAAMQSASENRQCKLTMTTYGWEGFAKTISGDARYLYEPTQTAQKAIARQGLGKTNGNVIEDLSYKYDYSLDIEGLFCFCVSNNIILK